MPPVRGHDTVFEADDDDASHDIPPLLDSRNPVTTYTFSTEMTPASFNPQSAVPISPPNFGSPVSPTGTDTLSSYIPEDPIPPPAMPPSTHTRTSHGKKRDASYIPRPPNAFILFRSSFIRSQRVPGNVEGNHSTLSKIIGKYWKALPREERERWEKEALAAQAEHRKKYPDWRFRPGANTVATKFRIKDAPAATTTRRRLTYKRSKDLDGVDTDATRTREKGKKKAKEKERPTVVEEERLAKIAQFLVDGKKGRELEIAVEEWEDGRRRMSALPRSDRDEPAGGPSCSKTLSDDSIDPLPDDILGEGSSRDSHSPSIPDSNDFTKIPLTHWFKRSQSEPAAPRLPSVESAGPLSAGASVPVVEHSIDTRPSSRGLDDHEPGHDSWWSPHVTSNFNTDTTGLGYEGIHIGSFDPDHISRFQAPLESQGDGSAAINWTKTSGGYIAAVEDPFINDKRGAEVGPTLLDSLSENTLQSAPMVVYPREPPSSFSSLAGWAGGISAAGIPGETKATIYGLPDSPYDLSYYGDWDNSYS